MTEKEKRQAENSIYGYLTGVPGEMQVLNALSSTGYAIAPITLEINKEHTDIMVVPKNELSEAILSHQDNPAVRMRRVDAKYSTSCPTRNNYMRRNKKILLETGEKSWGSYAGDEPIYIAYVWNGEGKENTENNVRIAMRRGKKRAKKRAESDEEEIALLGYYAHQEMINLYRKNEAALTTGFILFELKGLQNTYQEMKAEQEEGIKNDLEIREDINGVLIPTERYLSKYGAVIYRHNGQEWHTEIIGASRLQSPPAKAYPFEILCEIDHYREWWQDKENISNYDYIRYMRRDEHDIKAKKASSKYFGKVTVEYWHMMYGNSLPFIKRIEEYERTKKQEMDEGMKALRNKEEFEEYKKILAQLNIPAKKITHQHYKEALEQAKEKIKAKKAAEA